MLFTCCSYIWTLWFAYTIYFYVMFNDHTQFLLVRTTIFLSMQDPYETCIYESYYCPDEWGPENIGYHQSTTNEHFCYQIYDNIKGCGLNLHVHVRNFSRYICTLVLCCVLLLSFYMPINFNLLSKNIAVMSLERHNVCQITGHLTSCSYQQQRKLKAT